MEWRLVAVYDAYPALWHVQRKRSRVETDAGLQYTFHW